ncbi:MAG: LysR family transcriptional regulator [Polyangiaceae bacterium]|nr:LysR family transcriptional regulator [Polyangiaceae bacterium]
MDRLDEWRTFVAVATKRSFAEAARGQGRSPQAITRAIAALEERLGTRLLHRTTRAVSLTDDGALYVERARQLLAEFEALERSPREAVELRGTLTVAASVLFGQRHIVPIVSAFLDEHPAVDVRLLLHDRTVSLSEEGVDIAVRIGALADSALRARLVGHTQSIVCASPAYLERHGVPRTPDDLRQHVCIAFTGTTPIPDRWAFQSSGRRDQTVRVRAKLTVNTGQAAIDAALAGVGLVRVLSYQVGDLVAKKKLKVVLRSHEPPPLPVHLLQLPGVPTRTAASFADHAAARLRRVLS